MRLVEHEKDELAGIELELNGTIEDEATETGLLRGKRLVELVPLLPRGPGPPGPMLTVQPGIALETLSSSKPISRI